MKTLLISENQAQTDFLHKVFEGHFKRKSQLISASTQKDALNSLMVDGPFGPIIIDVTAKNFEPMALAEEILDIAGNRPIIFMGNKMMLNDRVDERFISDNPHFEMYETPIILDTFKQVIAKAVNWTKEQDFADSVVNAALDDFVPLKLRNFFLFKEIPYDVYIRLTDSKFVKAMPKGHKYNEAQLMDFASRGHRLLYLNKDEHLQFLINSINKISGLLIRKNTEPERLLGLQITAALLLQQHMQSIGVTQIVQTFMDELIMSIQNNFLRFETMKDFLKAFPIEQKDIPEKSVFVFYTCLFICQGVRWDSNLTQRKLGLASILHDCFLPSDRMIGVRYIDELKDSSTTEEQIEAYRNHPNEAAKLAANFNGISDTEFVVLEHHELPDGNGFPTKKQGWKLPPISALFSVANLFASEICARGIKRENLKNIQSILENEYVLGNLKPPQRILVQHLRAVLK